MRPYPALAGTVLVGFLALAGPSAGSDLMGAWRIDSALDPSGNELPAPPLVGADVVFAGDRVEAPSPLGCANATYETALVPPPGLFQGAFAEPEADAAALRLGMAGDAVTLRIACDTGLFDYHAAGERLLIMLDGVVYVLARAG